MLDRAEKDLKRGRPLLAVARSVADAPCWEKARAAGSLLCLRELSQACTRLSNFAKKEVTYAGRQTRSVAQFPSEWRLAVPASAPVGRGREKNRRGAQGAPRGATQSGAGAGIEREL